MKAAIPDYLQIDYDHLPPGHAFGSFLPYWNEQWEAESNKKTAVLKRIKFPPFAKKQQNALIERQQSIAIQNGAFIIVAESTSPFMTGTGIEHPLENGFSFLTPYGLPYLPGSGVKGVLRRTAELLVEGEFGEDTQGWTSDSIQQLFGYEGNDKELTKRGAFSFWDVHIQPKNNLGFDIMTPHFSDYYQGNDTPHESGTPVPIPFLVVPEGAGFKFIVECQQNLISSASLAENWREMLESLFELTFDWLGFGAKTATGYGQLLADNKENQYLLDQQEEQKKQEEDAKLSPVEKEMKVLRERMEAGEEKHNGAGGMLYQALKSVIANATQEWDTEDKQTLKALAIQMRNHFGIKANNDKFKKMLKSLNVQ